MAVSQLHRTISMDMFQKVKNLGFKVARETFFAPLNYLFVRTKIKSCKNSGSFMTLLFTEKEDKKYHHISFEVVNFLFKMTPKTLFYHVSVFNVTPAFYKFWVNTASIRIIQYAPRKDYLVIIYTSYVYYMYVSVWSVCVCVCLKYVNCVKLWLSNFCSSACTLVNIECLNIWL